MSDAYAHPTLTASYSRDTEDGKTVHFFDIGNGHGIQVTQENKYNLFQCELYIIPQFAGASVYNSIKADGDVYMTSLQTEVTEFIDAAIESHMLEVGSLDELKGEFND